MFISSIVRLIHDESKRRIRERSFPMLRVIDPVQERFTSFGPASKCTANNDFFHIAKLLQAH